MSIRTRKTLITLGQGVLLITALTVYDLSKPHTHFAITWPFVVLIVLWLGITAQRWWLYGPSTKAAEKRTKVEEIAEKRRARRARGITP